MKRRVLVLLVLGVVLFGVCAQRAEAQSANIAQKIIGTWVDQKGKSWVFDANGNLTMGTTRLKYGVTDTKLVLVDSDYGNNDAEEEIYNISISSDGKTLILDHLVISTPRNTAYTSGSIKGFWLIKK
jgi:hypothetical protein